MGATMRKCRPAKQQAMALLAIGMTIGSMIGVTGRAAAAMTGGVGGVGGVAEGDVVVNGAAPRALDLVAMARHDGERVTAGAPRLAEGAMAHRFRVTFTDSTGGVVAAPAGWGATAYLHRAGATEGEAIVRLSDAVPAVSIPRPLGVRLAVGDSLSVTAVLRGAGAPVAVRMRLAVDVEPAPLARTRMGVSALASQRVTRVVKGSESRSQILRDSDPLILIRLRIIDSDPLMPTPTPTPTPPTAPRTAPRRPRRSPTPCRPARGAARSAATRRAGRDRRSRG